MPDLVVRVYDVRFGDAVLVTIPEAVAGGTVKRNIMFDFGNALSTAGGSDGSSSPSSTTSSRGSAASRSTCS